jgi:hypothetical protein
MESMKLLSFSFEQWADSHDTDPPNQIVICESQEDSADRVRDGLALEGRATASGREASGTKPRWHRQGLDRPPSTGWVCTSTRRILGERS